MSASSASSRSGTHGGKYDRQGEVTSVLPKAIRGRCLNRVLPGLCLFLGWWHVAWGEPTDELETKARRLVSRMVAGEFEMACEPFDATMHRVLPADKLEAVWNGLVSQFGQLQEAEETRIEKVGQYTAVLVACRFERGELIGRVVFNREGEIAGLFFVPSDEYRQPEYVDPARFEEQEVAVGSGWFRLPGTLSLPRGEGPFPAVVLVHGSGPLDRDSTVGPNRPFRDLAQGLASRGIAVLRYEKRTHAHPMLTALAGSTLTVQQETVDDALAAVELLERHEKIDANHLFMEGEGKSTPQEYFCAGNVAAVVVDDIARWLQQQAPAERQVVVEECSDAP